MNVAAASTLASQTSQGSARFVPIGLAHSKNVPRAQISYAWTLAGSLKPNAAAQAAFREKVRLPLLEQSPPARREHELGLLHTAAVLEAHQAVGNSIFPDRQMRAAAAPG